MARTVGAWGIVLLGWLGGCDGEEPTTPVPTDEDPTDAPPTETGAPPPQGHTATAGTPTLEVCVNEIMASNATALADESGAYPDWFELHNPGASAVELGGWTVRDGNAEHELASALVIEAGGFLVLYADDDVAQGPDHVGFQLSAGGEPITLTSPEGASAIVYYRDLEPDVVLARTGDCCEEEGCWAMVPRGSPGATNEGPLLEETTVVAMTDTWRYWGGPGAVPAGWEDPAFDDSAWPRGAAPLGYGGGQDTVLPTAPAAALRLGFRIDDAPRSAALSLRRDDGVLVALDGVELVRDNLGKGPVTPTTRATLPIEGPDEALVRVFPLDPGLLGPGQHVLAVTVVQANPDGGDLLIAAELDVGGFPAR